ncbi:MAG: ABC transporter ATP-binding protein [Bdellovibrionales bacterium]|nr:ABC transporter ATP-binding protein [Bdellovibrionales bacterium]
MLSHWNFYKKLKGIFFLNIVTTVLFSALELAIAVLMQSYLQISGLVQQTSSSPFTWINNNLSLQSFCFFLLLVALIRLFVEFFMHYTSNIIKHKGILLLREKLFDRFLDHPPLSSTYVNHLNGTIFNHSSQYLAVLILFVSFGFLISLLLLYMFLISWKQALICIALTLLIGSFSKIVTKFAKKYADVIPHQNQLITQYIQKISSNFFYISLSKMTGFEKQKLHEKNKDIFQNAHQSTLLTSFSSSMTPFLGLLMIVAIFYTSQFTFKNQILNSISFLYLFMRYIQFLTSEIHYFGQLQIFKPHHDEALHFYASPTHGQHIQIESPKNILSVQNTPVQIAFDHVSFSYNKKTLFEDLTFTIKPGQCVGITGESGVGKSTLFSLILGYEKPTSGSILINHEQSQNFFAKHPISVGYVGPEPFLFEGTLKENILYGSHHFVSDEEIFHALTAVQLQEFASADLLSYKLTEDLSNLSSGQKQRLCIARAFLSKPSLLLLDEFSSNLDILTEKNIVKTLDEVRQNITTLIISHRESALKNVDTILTLQNRSGVSTIQIQ